MAIIANDEKVFMVSKSTNTTYSGSAALKAMQEWYTMQDVKDTVGVAAEGPQGVPGVQGEQGIPGTAGAVGPAGLNWQSTWVSGTSYVADDAVAYDGASWFCILATSGTTAPDLDATHWALLASQGAQGIQGIQGVQGLQGIQGIPGSSALQNYKSYVALISQSGTSDPTATVVFNDTAATFTWSYDDIGSYFVTCSSPILLSGKTVVFITTQGNAGNGQNKIFGGTRTNDSNVVLNTSTNGILDLNFEIRIYN
jgi:hypothetical protein